MNPVAIFLPDHAAYLAEVADAWGTESPVFLGNPQWGPEEMAEAARLLEQAYKGRPDAEIAAHFGEVLWSRGQRDRARAIWREGLLLNRENETLQETLKRLRVKP